MTKNTTAWLTERIESLKRNPVTASEYWTLLDDCKAELAKQAERVAELEAESSGWEQRAKDLAYECGIENPDYLTPLEGEYGFEDGFDESGEE